MSLLLISLLVMMADDPAPPIPAGMILEVSGKAEVKPVKGPATTAHAMQILFPGDRVVVGDKGQVTLSIFQKSRRERLKPGTEAKVTATGCEGPGVEKIQGEEQEPLPVRRGLQKLKVSDRGAVQLFRSEPPEAPPHVIPMPGSRVSSDRPSLSWPGLPESGKYTVSIQGSEGRVLWSASATGTRLEYPKEKPALRRGRRFSWTVSEGEPGGKRLRTGTFSVALEEDARALNALKPLTESKSQADLVLAALAYQNEGVFDEALRLFERLVKESPQEPEFHAALADFYVRSGRPEEAKKAREQASKLGLKLPEGKKE